MSKNKQPQVPKKNEVSPVRSSAAEYLTFVAASGHGGVEAIYADENVWLTQKMTGLLYDVETHTINYHLKKVFADSELEEDAVIRNFRIAATDVNQPYTWLRRVMRDLPAAKTVEEVEALLPWNLHTLDLTNEMTT